MEFIKRKTDYALRILCHFSKAGPNIIRNARDVAKGSSVSLELSRKILQDLVDLGILESIRGKNGGFKLNQTVPDLSLGNIIEHFQGEIAISKCSLSTHECPQMAECKVKKTVDRLNGEFRKLFKEVHLSEILDH